MSIDGDKVVEHDNEGQTPKPDSNEQQSSQKSDPQKQILESNAVDTNKQDPHNDQDKHIHPSNITSPGSDSANAPNHGIKSLEESMINTLGFLPAEDGDLEQTPDGKTLYIVFSTDCGR